MKFSMTVFETTIDYTSSISQFFRIPSFPLLSFSVRSLSLFLSLPNFSLLPPDVFLLARFFFLSGSSGEEKVKQSY